MTFARFYTLTFLSIFILGCKTTAVNTHHTAEAESETIVPTREHTIQTVLWQQNAAEYKALCYQAFALAKMQLDKKLEDKSGKASWAIVTDIDETLIDNSPYNAKMIQTDQGYSRETWVEWGQLEQAKSVPGAVEFLTYAASKGIDVFYISNRYATQQKETQANLKKLGFPHVDDAHFLLRKETSGKEKRRQTVAQSHEIIMLLGDNLSDFDEAFDNQSTPNRNMLVAKKKEEFGTTFIVLPNPMYGDWETKGLYEGKYDWSEAQRDSIRRANLKAY